MIWMCIKTITNQLSDNSQLIEQLITEELHRLILELALPGLVHLEHGERGGAEGTVVEEDDIRIQEKLFLEVIHILWGRFSHEYDREFCEK